MSSLLIDAASIVLLLFNDAPSAKVIASDVDNVMSGDMLPKLVLALVMSSSSSPLGAFLLFPISLDACSRPLTPRFNPISAAFAANCAKPAIPAAAEAF